MIAIEFDHLPPADASGNARGHWTRMYRAKKEFDGETRILLGQQGSLGVDCTASGPTQLIGKVSSHRWAQDVGLPCPACMGRGLVNPHMMLKATVTYHAYWCGKPMDADNLIKGCKAILDAIVAERLLPDDSPEHVEIRTQYTRVPHRADVKLGVTVEEVANG